MRPIEKALFAIAACAVLLTEPAGAQTAADANRGAQLFRSCAACHTLEPNCNMTGPSLSGLWNRKAGSLASFPRYSPAMKSAGVIWNDETLDRYLENPQHFIPGNVMTFPGIPDREQRAALLAYLKSATQSEGAAAQQTAQGGGMMMGGQAPNLRHLLPEQRVTAIHLCGDTYAVTTADGGTRQFWEPNLRFKTDSSANGPERGMPAILRAGMMGDRASIIFAKPEEISAIISQKC